MERVYLIIIIILAAASGIGFALFYISRKKETEARNRLDSFFKTGNKFIMLWKNDLSSIHINDALRSRMYTLGRSADANFILSIFDSEKTPDNFTPAALLVKSLDKNGVDSVFTTPAGERCYIKWRSEIVDNSKSAVTIISEGTDETEVRYLKNELYRQRMHNFISEENFDMAMESAEIGIIYISVDDLPKIEMSAVGKKMLGFADYEELTIDALSEKVYSVDSNGYKLKLKNLLSGEDDTLEIEIKMLTENKEYHDFMLKWHGVKDSFGNVERITGAIIDITYQRERYNLYDSASLIDPTSGIYNRKGFMEKGQELLQSLKGKGFKAVLASVKIERMLKITTLFGNEMWERLLKCYAEGLVKFSWKDSVVGRIGSDDYAVIMACREPESNIEKLAKELMIFLENSCNDEILPSNLKEQVRFDAGICVYDGIDDIQTLFYKANIMLYAGDDLGNKICHFYNDEVEKKLHDSELIEYEMSSALKHNELELYYQPKISFKTGEIIGAEALMRWNHPKRGLIQPSDFIPLAEDMGIIIKMDEWGLTQACHQNKYWQVKGYKHIKVSINMSKVQLYQTDVVETLKRAINESGLSPEYIEIEITETMAVQDMEHTINVLNNMRMLGVTVSMDDFGTGYSSLSAIKQLPIDVLKVDRSMICDVCENPAAVSVVKAIIEMGKAMDFKVVAEGVETQEQWDILQDLGCDEAQGYFHGKPLSTAELERKFFMTS